MSQRLDAFRTRIGGYAFGGDYNPEQWDRATWDEALDRAAAALSPFHPMPIKSPA